MYPKKASFRKVLQGNPPSALIEVIVSRNNLRFVAIEIECFFANSNIAILADPIGFESRPLTYAAFTCVG